MAFSEKDELAFRLKDVEESLSHAKRTFRLPLCLKLAKAAKKLDYLLRYDISLSGREAHDAYNLAEAEVGRLCEELSVLQKRLNRMEREINRYRKMLRD